MGHNFADNIPDDQRVERAKMVTDKLVDHVLGLIAMAENNAQVLYSDGLSRQIPKSFAAHAFNELQQCMHHYFMVRLCAIWDSASNDRESIPSVMALIGKESVRERFVQAAYDYHSTMAEPRSLTPTNDPVERQLLADHWATYRVKRAEEESIRVKRWINFVTKAVPTIQSSCVDNGLRAFRDGYLAHNLASSAVNKGMPIKIKYGDEAKLFRLTIRIVDRLHLSLNRTGFAWDTAQKNARRNAYELWSSCGFDIPTG